MTNSIRKVGIWRTMFDGKWDYLEIIVVTESDSKYFASFNHSDTNEDEALSGLLDDFEREFDFNSIRIKIIQGFQQLRGRHSSGNNTEVMIVPVAAEDLLEPHFSCNKNDSEDSTTESLQENETPQSEIIQKLKNVK